MKKYVLDLKVSALTRLGNQHLLIKCKPSEGNLPPMLPGQFAQLRIDTSAQAYLRRPISIHYVDEQKDEVWFLVQMKGEGTRSLASLATGDILNVVAPLGNGFTLPTSSSERVLLVGGGVGVAPLLYLGRKLREMGHEPTFLLGARSAQDLLQAEEYEALGTLYVTTEDGSRGEKGFVTQHSILQTERFSRICVCGPLPMMQAVARYAYSTGTPCEVSLENKMACGIGACLCCVEDIQEEGHVCVCKDGPVFNINQLKWQI